jgi:hypothetical protein
MTATAKMKKSERKKIVRRPPPPPLGNQRALGNEGGRPTSYRPEYADRARQLCQLGTDVEMARFFNVAPSTFYLWRLAHPEFSEAVKVGKSLADDRVERSLYQRAIGYEHDSVKTVEENVVSESGAATLVKRTTTTQTQHVPGDVGAEKLWLTNRRPRQWRDRIDVVEDRPQRSSAEIKEIIVQKLLDWGVKLVPFDPPLIEGAAKVTNGVAGIGVKTRGPNG